MQLTKNRIIFLSILMGALFFVCPDISAQNSVSNDSLSIKNKKPKVITEKIPVADSSSIKNRQHNPRVAMLSSALVPGLGQIYNKRYWKVPIIWGGGLALYMVVDYNNTLYQRFKTAEAQSKAEETITDPDLKDFTESSLTQYKDSYRSSRDQAYIYLGLLYVANIVDAMVDGYLLNYDISEDLSLEWQPTVIPPNPATYRAATYGLQVKLRF